jgi:hypothetical protein
MRIPLRGLFTSFVFWLPPVLLLTGCGDGDSRAPGHPTPDAGIPGPDAGIPGGRAVAANGVVSGGTVMRSPRYRLVGSMSPGVADGSVGASPRFAFRSGLVGASQ